MEGDHTISRHDILYGFIIPSPGHDMCRNHLNHMQCYLAPTLYSEVRGHFDSFFSFSPISTRFSLSIGPFLSHKRRSDVTCRTSYVVLSISSTCHSTHYVLHNVEPLRHECLSFTMTSPQGTVKTRFIGHTSCNVEGLQCNDCG